MTYMYMYMTYMYITTYSYMTYMYMYMTYMYMTYMYMTYMYMSTKIHSVYTMYTCVYLFVSLSPSSAVLVCALPPRMLDIFRVYHVYTYIHNFVCTYAYTYMHTHGHISLYTCLHIHNFVHTYAYTYGVATISRIDKIIGLFCRIASLLWGSFAKET